MGIVSSNVRPPGGSPKPDVVAGGGEGGGEGDKNSDNSKANQNKAALDTSASV